MTEEKESANPEPQRVQPPQPSQEIVSAQVLSDREIAQDPQVRLALAKVAEILIRDLAKRKKKD